MFMKDIINEGYLYDWENSQLLERQNRDINFYIDIINKYFSNNVIVLEMGCGTGRITIPLSHHVSKVVGVDISKDRINVADYKAKKLSINNICFLCEDMCKINFSTNFDLIIIPYSTFQLLDSDRERKKCLTIISKFLSQDGLAIIDISNNFMNKLHHVDKRIVTSGYCAYYKENITLFENCIQDYYNQTTTINKNFVFSDGREFLFTEKWFTVKENEIKWLISDLKIEVTEIYGTYEYDYLYDKNGNINKDSYKKIFIIRRKEI